MRGIWNGLLILIFLVTIMWSLSMMFILLSYYFRLVIKSVVWLIFKMPNMKKKYEWNPVSIDPERYYSLFRTPLFFYLSLPFLALLVTSFINDYVLKNLWLNNSAIYVTSGLLIVFFWISVYIIFSQCREKKQIKKALKSHRQFIKITMFPISLLSIIVPIFSLINIVIENETKQNLFYELTNLSLNNNSIVISFLFIYILVLEGLSLLVMGLLEHIIENESEYGYFFRSIFSIFRNFF